MGSYSELKLGSFYIGSIKNEIDPFLMTLYREADKRINVVAGDEVELEHDYGLEDLEGETVTVVQYVCQASIIRDRLELMGFTRKVAEAGFRKGRQLEIERYQDFTSKKYGDVFKEPLSVLQNLTLEKWLGSLQEIHKQNLKPTRYSDPSLNNLNPLLRYMLTNDWYGFPGYDYRHFLRLLLDVCGVSDELVYDLTDLHLGGWVDGTDDLVEYAEEIISDSFDLSRRVIVLTEGNSDRWILERSLKLLYPHISDYFHFLDFEGARIGGGAGSLANIVKAFTGAGIINRIIALFDNDTAAKSAINTLNLISLPDNIVVLQYPPINLAKSYPTIGPTGLATMDVNGLAGSIELYLGADILSDQDGKLSPVQWQGYDAKLGKYQGEILDKGNLLKKFDDKVSKCESDTSKVAEYDWSGINAIIDEMRRAFHAKDSKEIFNDMMG